MSAPLVAIVGSRDWPPYAVDRIERAVAALPEDAIVVSGGARGVDIAAVVAAKARGLTTIEFLPDPELVKSRGFAFAAYDRNIEIARKAHRAIAFRAHRSPGTSHTLGKLAELGKPVELHQINLQAFTAFASYGGDDRIDVTRKSGGEEGDPFAPSWDLLRPFLELRRAGALTPDHHAVYREAYLAEMRRSFERKRAAWDQLLSYDEATLVCYCPDPAFCHRTILAKEILPRLGAVYRGERPPEPSPQLSLF